MKKNNREKILTAEECEAMLSTAARLQRSRTVLPYEENRLLPGLIEQGHDVWRTVYGKGRLTNAEAFDVILRQHIDDFSSLGPQRLSDHFTMLTVGSWVDGAARVLKPATEDFFAAMCATDVMKQAYEDLRLPWPAFAVEIPSGMLTNDSAEYRLAVIGHLRQISLPLDLNFERRTQPRDVGVITVYPNNPQDPWLSTFTVNGLADLLFEPQPTRDPRFDEQTLEEEVTTIDERAIECLKKAIVGMLYTMQHTNNWQKGSRVRSSLKNDPRFGPPDHRTIVVGRPVSISVGAAVRDYVQRGSKAPSFQSLVRGHHKRQVIGKGRSGRKIIWVEPYWRGPEHAPIMSRPYSVG